MTSPAVSSQNTTLAEFKPFQAWRYNPSKVKMTEVIAPPYDVISAQEQNALYDRSPYNCVRLILNRIEESDTPDNNRYSRARDCFREWQERGVLSQETGACFYIYRQDFRHPVDGKRYERTSILGRLKLEPFEKGIVVPHEKTLAKPREDRRKLLEATETNFSPVFGLYDDPQGAMAAIFSEASKDKPVFEALDDQDVSHVVWAVRLPATVEKIETLFAQKKVFIADGHHRYQTALEYARDRRAKDKVSADAVMPYDYVLMALVEFHDRGLVCLPTHRMVLPYPAFSQEKALEALRKFFKVEELPLEKATARLAKAETSAPIAFVLCLGKESYLLSLLDERRVRAEMPQGKPEVWYELDLNVLTHFILQKLWSLPPEIYETALRYSHHEKEAVEAVKTQSAKAAFILRAPRVEALRDMGEVRELMPQKSTYFYPKLASGLVFYSHKETR